MGAYDTNQTLVAHSEGIRAMPNGPRKLEAMRDLIERREHIVDALGMLPSITPSDLSGLDRLGLCMVAGRHMPQCSPDAVQLLLNSEHPQVRDMAMSATTEVA